MFFSHLRFGVLQRVGRDRALQPLGLLVLLVIVSTVPGPDRSRVVPAPRRVALRHVVTLFGGVDKNAEPKPVIKAASESLLWITELVFEVRLMLVQRVHKLDHPVHLFRHPPPVQLLRLVVRRWHGSNPVAALVLAGGVRLKRGLVNDVSSLRGPAAEEEQAQDAYDMFEERVSVTTLLSIFNPTLIINKI